MANLNVDFSEHCELIDYANNLYIICGFILMSTCEAIRNQINYSSYL